MMLGFLTRPLITNFVRTLGFTTVLLILAVWPLHPLDIYMEENRPFNYSSDQGLSGISVELLLAASDAVGLGITRKDIQVVPWVRGYQLIGEKADTVLFSTARTEARENQFLWAGPIASLEIVVIGPRDDRNHTKRCSRTASAGTGLSTGKDSERDFIRRQRKNAY